MLRKSSLFFALTCSLLLSACAGETEIDDLAGDEADLSADVASSSQSTYFTVRPDYRRCVSPLCGGKWVAEVNKDKTRCADGRKADECYVAELDLAGLGLSDDVLATLDFGRKGGVLLRGELSNKRFGSFGKLGVFTATEAWNAGSAAAVEPEGVFVRLSDAGIRCITTPCNSTREAKLNASLTAMIAAIDFVPSAATEDEIGTASNAMISPDGLIIAGDRYTVTGPGGRGKARTATQFWTRAQATCAPTGCSGHICADHNINTICTFEPEYACYWEATCERQPEGTCGWTPTVELQECLENPPVQE